MQITPIYAAIFGLMFVALSYRVIHIRKSLKVALGDGGDSKLCRAIRVHGNFVEYVPLTLMLIGFVENQTHNAVLVHALCIVFLLARLAHAYGVSQVGEDLRFRVAGLFTTGIVISVSSVTLLIGGL